MANKNTKKNIETSNGGFNNFKKGHSVVSKKGLAIGIATACALVTLGGLTAGHFAYKYTHSIVNTDQPTVSPAYKDEVTISEFKTNKNGDKVGTVTSKTEKTFVDIKVSIGGTALVEGDDYTWQPANKSNRATVKGEQVTYDSAVVTIKKAALAAHKGVIEIVPVFSAKKFIVTFDKNCDESSVINPSSQEVDRNGYAVSPHIYWKNHELLGWYLDEGCEGDPFDFKTTKITEDITLFAKWKEVIDPGQYLTVTFSTGDGCTVIPSQFVPYMGKASRPGNPEYKDNTKLFDNWYDGAGEESNVFDFDNTEITGDTTIYAHYKDNLMTVNFIDDQGTLDTKEVVYGNTVSQITPRDKTGYTFSYWTLDGNEFDFSTVITSNINLVAKYTAIDCNVVFEVDGGTAISPVVVPYGSTIATEPGTSKEGYTFAGWYKEQTFENEFVFGTGEDATKIVNKDTSIYAKWTKNTYKVTYIANGGSGLSKSSEDVDYGDTIPNEPTATKVGYELDGWYNGETKFIFEDTQGGGTPTQVTGPITLVAKWTEKTPTQIDSLVLKSGTTSITVGQSDEAQAKLTGTYAGHIKYSVNDPEKASIDVNTGYITGLAAGDVTITATYCNEAGTEIGVSKTLDITITAPITSHIVSFDSNGGSIFVPAKVVTDEGTIATSPDAGTKENWNFEGWHIGSATGDTFVFGNLGTQVTSDITLVANWVDADPVTQGSLTMSTNPITTAGGTSDATVVWKDSGGGIVSSPTGTVSYSIDQSLKDVGATINSTNGTVTAGNTSGSGKVTATYTTKAGTEITATYNLSIALNP